MKTLHYSDVYPNQKNYSFLLEVAFLMELCPSGFSEPVSVIIYRETTNEDWVAFKCWNASDFDRYASTGRYLKQLLIYD